MDAHSCKPFLTKKHRKRIINSLHPRKVSVNGELPSQISSVWNKSSWSESSNLIWLVIWLEIWQVKIFYCKSLWETIIKITILLRRHFKGKVKSWILGKKQHIPMSWQEKMLRDIFWNRSQWEMHWEPLRVAYMLILKEIEFYNINSNCYN